MATFFITGTNRGLGLEMVRQLANQGHEVIATSRSKSEVLEEVVQENPSVSWHSLDVTNEDSFKPIIKTLDGKIIDVLIANAGAMAEYSKGIEELSIESMKKVFDVNLFGVIRTLRLCLPGLRLSEGGKAVLISSKVGSIADNGKGGAYAYRSSKTALNMIHKSLSIELKPTKITSIVMHPGWVQTDMGGGNAPTTPLESVKGMLKVIDGLSKKDSGKFIDFLGKEIPW